MSHRASQLNRPDAFGNHSREPQPRDHNAANQPGSLWRAESRRWRGDPGAARDLASFALLKHPRVRSNEDTIGEDRVLDG